MRIALVRRSVLAVLVFCHVCNQALDASAQPAADLPRIAYVANGTPDDFRIQGFRQALQDVGYVIGENIAVEYFLVTSFDELPAVVPRVLASRPDVIWSVGTPPTLALKQATTTIPIVFSTVTDPVGSGIVASLARPGGNVTGNSLNLGDLAGKTLELLAEMAPGASPTAVFYNSNNSGSSQPQVSGILRAAAALDIDVRLVDAEGTDNWDEILAGLITEGVQALLFTADITYGNNVPNIIAAVLRHPLPVMFSNISRFVDAGGLMNYGLPPTWTYERAAFQVSRILQGADPRDMPVEQPREFELRINRRTADALGLTIPASLLLRATEVIE